MTRRPFHLLLAMVAVFALAATACGGDDDSTATTTTTTTSAGSSADDNTDASTPDDATGSSDPSGSAGAAFSSEECQQLADAFDQQQLSESLTSGTDPTEQLRATADHLAQAAEKAPAQVAADVQVMADVYDQLADASARIDWDGATSGNPAAAMGAAELGRIYASNPGFATAGQNLAAYAAEHCTPGN